MTRSRFTTIHIKLKNPNPRKLNPSLWFYETNLAWLSIFLSKAMHISILHFFSSILVYDKRSTESMLWLWATIKRHFTYVTSPTTSSCEPVSLSNIFKMSSSAPSEMVNTKFSFHSGSDPFPVCYQNTFRVSKHSQILKSWRWWGFSGLCWRCIKPKTWCNTAFLLLWAATKNNIRIHVTCSNPLRTC